MDTAKEGAIASQTCRQNCAVAESMCLMWQDIFEGAYPGCVVMNSPHGGITEELLTKCIERIAKLGGASPENEILLLMDGHDSRAHYSVNARSKEVRASTQSTLVPFTHAARYTL